MRPLSTREKKESPRKEKKKNTTLVQRDQNLQRQAPFVRKNLRTRSLGPDQTTTTGRRLLLEPEQLPVEISRNNLPQISSNETTLVVAPPRMNLRTTLPIRVKVGSRAMEPLKTRNRMEPNPALRRKALLLSRHQKREQPQPAQVSSKTAQAMLKPLKSLLAARRALPMRRRGLTKAEAAPRSRMMVRRSARRLVPSEARRRAVMTRTGGHPSGLERTPTRDLPRTPATGSLCFSHKKREGLEMT